MAEKVLQTRIQLKYDTYENWVTNNPVLKKGEMAIATIGKSPTQAVDSVTAPQVILKVGDGTTAYKNLPFASALAADVYNWAKTTAPVLENQTINFKDAKGNVVHSIDLSDFVTNGELTSILTEYQPKGNYKTVQTAKNYTGTTVKTVTSLKQDTNGVITEIGFEDIAFPDAPDITITDGEAIETPSTATVNVYKNLTANGHTLTEDLVEVATAKGVADALAEAKKYADDNDTDTNTAHTHINGTGIKVNGTENGGIDGEVKLDLNVKFLPELTTKTDNKKYLQLVDATDTTKLIAEFDTTEFIKDGMLDDVEYNADTNTLTFTWNTDAGKKTDTVILSDILDPYVFEAGAKLDVAIDGTKVTYSHEAIAAPTKTAGSGRTYITDVTTDGYGHITGYKTATESDQDLSGYKTKQTAVAEKGAADKTLKISQNENGEITVTEQAISIKHTQVNDWDANIGVKSISADTGLKINTTGTGITAQTPQIAIDESVTFIFDCGTSTTVI